MWALALWDGRAAAALLLARPLRREAVLLLVGRRAARVRERAEGVPRRRARSSRTCPRSATSSSRATSTTRTTRSSPGIRKLPPAHSLVVDERGLRLEPLLGARAARRGRRLGRRRARALPRRGPPAPAQRRPRRHVPLGRDRLVGDRLRRRPPPPHRGRERAARRRPPAHVHRVLRGARLRRAAVRGGGRRADALAAALGHVRLARARRRAPVDRPRRRTSRSARRRSSRSGS